MFSVSREAAQHSSMDRKTSAVLDARKQSTFDARRPSSDRRQSYAPFNVFRDEIPAVSLLLHANYHHHHHHHHHHFLV